MFVDDLEVFEDANVEPEHELFVRLPEERKFEANLKKIDSWMQDSKNCFHVSKLRLKHQCINFYTPILNLFKILI